MFVSVDNFLTVFKQETDATRRLLDKLTDDSLSQPNHPDIRSVGRAAWHIVTTYPELCGHLDIAVDGPGEKDPVPAKAADIIDAYAACVAAVSRAVKNWPDADLQKVDDLYGEQWPRGKSLHVLLAHEIHHRGQLTVFMRLAGLPVPGIYGPSKEEWANYGTEPPAV